MDIIHNFHGARNGVVHCTCNRSYCDADQEDVVDHARHHAEFVRVTRNRGHVPYGYDLREQLKDAGRKLLHNATSDHDISIAADMIVRAYFDRSFQHAIERGYGDLHPSLVEYARTIAEDGQLDPRVNTALLAAYRDAARAQGAVDATLWDPPAGTNPMTN